MRRQQSISSRHCWNGSHSPSHALHPSYTKETQNAAKNLEQKFTFQLGTLKLQGIIECLSAKGRLMMIKNGSISRNIRRCPAPPKCLADPSAVDRAICVLREARKPLVIIGKGIYKKNILL